MMNVMLETNKESSQTVTTDFTISFLPPPSQPIIIKSYNNKLDKRPKSSNSTPVKQIVIQRGNSL